MIFDSCTVGNLLYCCNRIIILQLHFYCCNRIFWLDRFLLSIMSYTYNSCTTYPVLDKPYDMLDGQGKDVFIV